MSPYLRFNNIILNKLGYVDEKSHFVLYMLFDPISSKLFNIAHYWYDYYSHKTIERILGFQDYWKNMISMNKETSCNFPRLCPLFQCLGSNSASYQYVVHLSHFILNFWLKGQCSIDTTFTKWQTWTSTHLTIFVALIMPTYRKQLSR